MVPVLSRSREFSLFLDGTGTGTGKNWSRKKVPVPEKFGPGRKYRSWYRKKLVLEKSTGPGTGKNSGHRHTLKDASLNPNCSDSFENRLENILPLKSLH